MQKDIKWLEKIVKLDINLGLKQTLMHYAGLANDFNCDYVTLTVYDDQVLDVTYTDLDWSSFKNKLSFKRAEIYYNKNFWSELC